ncbi:glycoside hydrolase family 65 protein [Mesorhizobium sp. LjNodule214]|uniref:glycoside hydrolase family 65 protein n=1 Tax=Mesorhizobium sp. LjNodule214 TaxID=3342252 RepID=UPI003ECFB0D1
MRDQLNAGEWLVEEEGFDIGKANVFETLFTLGNGYLGTRGTLEEGFKGEVSGTYLNGVFDAHDSPVIDLVNAPDWLAFAVQVDGIRLDVQSCKVVDHNRALDMRQGALWRSTVFEDGHGRRTRIETLRFASLDDQHFCGLRVEITPENHDAPIIVESALDGRRFNLERMPAYVGKPEFHPEVKWEKWAKSKHLDEVTKDHSPEAIYLEMRTIDTGITIGYAASTVSSLAPRQRTVHQSYERIGEQLEFALGIGETVRLDKLVTIYKSRDSTNGRVSTRCLEALAAHRASGFDVAFELHRAAWLRKWADCDCVILGDAEANNAVRFNIYHLLIAANEGDPTVNVGAKSLSGEGYRGHIFWDTEIFMLPFFLYTQPATAKALMLYRYHTLKGARENALRNEFSGAQFPWESADTGLETTPKWTPDGVHRIWMGEEEIHVTADVAYGLLTYVAATGDMEFMLDFGAEILFETSRFWVERLEYVEMRDQYVLTRVMGPDEFHEHVDNNAFTNRMAQWHLVQAARVHAELARHHSRALIKIAGKIGLHPDEVERWREIADKILIPFDADRGLIEQFEGYFQLKEVPVTEWDQNGMPCYPQGYHHFNAGETTLLKQPDVIMLMYVLSDEFDAAVKKVNYDFYEPRTLHKSSLSPAIHSIMGIEVGDPGQALQYFHRTAFVDLTNNQGNTHEGIHIAAAAGAWQILVFGFGGFRVMHGKMTFRPWLPQQWQELRFRLKWHGNTVDAKIRHGEVSFQLQAPDGANETIVVFNEAVALAANKETFVRFPAMAVA